MQELVPSSAPKLPSMADLEKRTDTELVQYLVGHIEEPCQDPDGNNVRNVYLGMARDLLPRIKNPFARNLLEKTIKKYE